MARVASCPQCNHELLVPGEADGEAWAKCPECRAFFQVKEATLRDLPVALLVEAGEQELVESGDPNSESKSNSTVDDFSSLATLRDMGTEPDATRQEDVDLELDKPIDQVDEPKSGDELEAAAQRIDEWFRSAKTVANAAPITDDEASFSEAAENAFEPASPARTNATIDLDAGGIDEMAGLADFDLDDSAAEEPSAAWNDSDRMEDILADIEVPSSDEFVAAVAHEDEAIADELDSSGEGRPSINMFADDVAPKVKTTKRRAPRRERSLVRSLVLITAAGIVGLAAGYYALLWLRGPSIDFLNIAHYLPPAMLPGSFQEKNQIARSTPPTTTADTAAEAETTAEEPAEPQELAPATDETASSEAATSEAAATETAPSDVTEEPAEMQADYTETEPAADTVASAVGDRYAPGANEVEPASAEETAPTDLTTEEPASTELASEEPASTELATTEPAALEPELTEPAPLEAPAADPLFDISETEEVAETVEPVTIANSPTFTADDLRASLDAATKAQPQLVGGNFADGKEVQRAKGFGFSMLADLAQKATFVDDAAKRDGAELATEAEDLFRKTLADAHTRGEVAQILPKWLASPNRKHGGVFLAGSVASHENAGSVVECKVELDGGQTLTILTPSNGEAESLDSTKPMAIVGWVVDKPKEQVGGYTGNAPQAIWVSKLIPLE